MDVEIGTEAVQFLEKEYINGIFLAVWTKGTVIVISGIGSHTPCFSLDSASELSVSGTDEARGAGSWDGCVLCVLV
jgi:hypothetical protein